MWRMHLQDSHTNQIVISFHHHHHHHHHLCREDIKLDHVEEDHVRAWTCRRHLVAFEKECDDDDDDRDDGDQEHF